LPELTILQPLAPSSIEDLRRLMIGTTKVVSKCTATIPSKWGSSCLTILQQIQNHDSYASRRYYYYTYVDYFDKLFRSLANITASMRIRGEGLIVLQDSYYKNLHVLTPEICTEMLRSLSCSASIVHSIPVRSHMGQMSPRQQVYVPKKQLTERIVRFVRV
jgi:hypothetical protein